MNFPATSVLCDDQDVLPLKALAMGWEPPQVPTHNLGSAQLFCYVSE